MTNRQRRSGASASFVHVAPSDIFDNETAYTKKFPKYEQRVYVVDGLNPEEWECKWPEWTTTFFLLKRVEAQFSPSNKCFAFDSNYKPHPMFSSINFEKKIVRLRFK
ncbi:hypothetical protein TNCV_445801 [Trichonephila clavipes]|nr:hypothetical protein TNCV_445801 [Trichonephila clavipes]